MNALRQRTHDHAPRFYSPDYRRQLREAGAFRDLSLSEHVVLAALCDRANATGIAWPAVETIANQYGLGESTVREAIKRLTDRGLLLVVRHQGRTNTYKLAMPGLEVLASAGDSPLESRTYPSRISDLPLQNLAPIMTIDHTNDHDQQQHHAGAPAHEAAAFLTTLLTEETHQVDDEVVKSHDETDQVGSTDVGAGAPIVLLGAELVDRVRQLGIAPAKVNRYGAERVRWVLDRLDVERQRKVIGNPAGWVVQVLKDTLGEPVPVLQPGVTFAAVTVVASRPPEGTRWARHREGGPVIAVDVVTDACARLGGGFNAGVIPARHWGEWEWFTEHPAGVFSITDENRGVGSHDPGAEVPREGALEGSGVSLDLLAGKQRRLGLVAICAALPKTTPEKLAAMLERHGLTRAELDAYSREKS